jgi:dTDP-glucose 4,6-dehydratase
MPTAPASLAAPEPFPFARVIVTGGAGFIGSALVRHLIASTSATVVTLDKLTYAGSLEGLELVAMSGRHVFERIDIADEVAVRAVFARHRPDAVLHLAAESHVDRSIGGPRPFIDSNVVGTYVLLEAARAHWQSLDGDGRAAFRFLHVSTDEVYGSLGDDGLFTEDTPYRPSSPYSATKAAADHLVRAWHRTYGLPILITNCSNNFGPWQYPEKLIPVLILSAIDGRPLPIYGTGKNVRDWIYVLDHVEALVRVVSQGTPGETYNVGAGNERNNLDMAHAVCSILDSLLPRSPHQPHASLIRFVPDRPGHDLRYAIDGSKLERELGWTARRSFDEALTETVAWYVENRAWCDRVLSRAEGAEPALAVTP